MSSIPTDRLPIWRVAQDTIVSKMGDTTIAFSVTTPQHSALSEEQYILLHETLLRAVKVLMAFTVVHFQGWYYWKKWRKSSRHVEEDADAEFLSAASDRHFHGRQYLDSRAYIFISLSPARRGIPPGKSLLYKNLVPQDTMSAQNIGKFRAAVDEFARILTSCGLISLRQLCTEDLASSPDSVGLIESYCQLLMPGEPPVSRDIDFTNGMRIGNRYCMIHSLSDAEQMPAACSPCRDHDGYSSEGAPIRIGFGSPAGILLPVDHIYNVYLFIDSVPEVRKKLERKGRHMQSLSPHSRENVLGKAAVDAYLDEAINGQKTIVRMHVNVFSWTDDPGELSSLRSHVTPAFASMGIIIHEETVGAAQLLAAGIPGNAADMPPYETFFAFAEQALCFLALESGYQPDENSAGLRVTDRLYGGPLLIDLTDRPMAEGWISNLNKLVLGGSGSGKSYFLNHLIRSYLASGAHVVISDIGNSYQGLCTLLKGCYFTHSADSPLAFNPFLLAPEERFNIEKKESQKALLAVLWKREDETMLRSEYVALSIAIQLYYSWLDAHPDIFPCFDSFYEFLMDEYTMVVEADGIKDRDFDIQNFLYVLRPFYKGGEFHYLLNATTQLDLLHQPFIVFELDILKDHPILFPVVAIIIMDLFTSKIRLLPGILKVKLIEEAWKPLMRPSTAGYVLLWLKTLRKFNGVPIIATQEISDLMGNAILKETIINLCESRILLGQSSSKKELAQLQLLLGLTEKDMALVQSLNRNRDTSLSYKEVFIALGNAHSHVYRVETSLEEYLVYTSREKDKIKVQEYARQYGGYKEGIIALAAAIRNGSVKLVMIGLMLMVGLLHTQKTCAQFPIADIIQAAVKKVIVATDLAIQRLQTQTIVAQETQRAAENEMQSEELSGITGWVQRQKDLYEGYYNELWQVKQALTVFQKVGTIISGEVQLLTDYRHAWMLISRDGHFTAAELTQMAQIYSVMIRQGERDVGLLIQVMTGGALQMEDGARLSIIDELAASLAKNRRDLQSYTDNNILLSLQRSKDLQDMQMIKAFYGIQ